MEDVIDLASSPSPFRRRRTTSSLEVIELDSPAVEPKPSPQPAMPRRRIARKRGRGLWHAAAASTDGDGESNSEVEIIEAEAQSSSSPRKRPAKMTPFPADATPDEESQWVARIREVFPLINRRRAHELVQMARGFAKSGRGEEIVVSVMQVLSADPTGTGITSKSFAVNAVGMGGSLEESNTGPRLHSDGPPTLRNGGKVTELECKCCYGEYTFDQMVCCKSGHLFCSTCLARHVETRVFGIGNLGAQSKESGKALEILCMSANCGQGFSELCLQRCLDDKVLKKYNELQFKLVVENACDNIAKCPRCNFMAIPDPNWPPCLFHCPECKFKFAWIVGRSTTQAFVAIKLNQRQRPVAVAPWRRL